MNERGEDERGRRRSDDAAVIPGRRTMGGGGPGHTFDPYQRLNPRGSAWPQQATPVLIGRPVTVVIVKSSVRERNNQEVQKTRQQQNATTELGSVMNTGKYTSSSAPCLNWKEHGCQFFGIIATHGFCSSCFAKVNESLETATHNSNGPIIMLQPSGHVAKLRSNVVFKVVAKSRSGNELHYQWYMNGTPIRRATSDQLIVRSISQKDCGNYVCQVSDRTASTLSSAANLELCDTATLKLFEYNKLVEKGKKSLNLEKYAVASDAFEAAIATNVQQEHRWLLQCYIATAFLCSGDAKRCIVSCNEALLSCSDSGFALMLRAVAWSRLDRMLCATWDWELYDKTTHHLQVHLLQVSGLSHTNLLCIACSFAAQMCI